MYYYNNVVFIEAITTIFKITKKELIKKYHVLVNVFCFFDKYKIVKTKIILIPIKSSGSKVFRSNDIDIIY